MKRRDVLGQIRALQAHMAAVRDQRQEGLFADLAERFLSLSEQPTFRDLGRPTQDPLLVNVLTQLAGGLCGRPTQLSNLLMIGIPEVGFLHGFAVAGEWLVMFFWSTASSEGLAVFSGHGGDNRLFRMTPLGTVRHPGEGAGAAVPGEH